MNISGFTIDALLVLLFLICLLSGRSKGFFRTVATLAFSIVGLIIAKALAEPAGEWLTDNFIHERLVTYFSGVLQENVANGSNAAIAALPEYLVNAAKEAGFSFRNILGSSFSPSQITSLATKLATTSETVFKPVITGLGYAFVFVGFKIVSYFVTVVFSFIFKLPGLNMINNLLGLILGALKGLIFVLVISSLLLLYQNSFETSDLAIAITSSNIVHIFGGILTGIIVS